jgi:uncharacterized protein
MVRGMNSTTMPTQAQPDSGHLTREASLRVCPGDRSHTAYSLDGSKPSNARFLSNAAQSPVAGAILSVTLKGPAGRLEAVLNLGSPDAPFAALVCHPHPVFGGNLHNKVVYHAMKAMNDPQWGLGWPVLRFNFRGMGRSEGVHDGDAEISDVLAATDWLEHELRQPIVVAGFSFGAAMALRACAVRRQSHDDVRAIVAIGLPTQVEDRSYHYSFLSGLAVPKLFLSGDRDPFASAAELAEIVESSADPKHLVLMRGADHFFTDRLEWMQAALSGWLKEQVQ